MGAVEVRGGRDLVCVQTPSRILENPSHRRVQRCSPRSWRQPHEYTEEGIIDVPTSQLIEEISEGVKLASKVVDLPIAVRHQVRTVQEGQRMVKQFIDDAVDVPVAMWRQVPVNEHMGEVTSRSTRAAAQQTTATSKAGSTGERRRWRMERERESEKGEEERRKEKREKAPEQQEEEVSALRGARAPGDREDKEKRRTQEECVKEKRSVRGRRSVCRAATRAAEQARNGHGVLKKHRAHRPALVSNRNCNKHNKCSSSDSTRCAYNELRHLALRLWNACLRVMTAATVEAKTSDKAS